MSAETFPTPARGVEPDVALRNEHIRLHRDIEAYSSTISDIDENLNQPDFYAKEQGLVEASRTYFENRLLKDTELLRQMGCLSLEHCNL